MEKMEMELGAFAPASALPVPTDGRARIRDELRKALDGIGQGHGRIALILVEVNSDYAARAAERIDAVLAQWQRQQVPVLSNMGLDRHRFALILGPVGLPNRARTLAKRFERSLDPRVCPLLQRALPYAWVGVSVCPEEGADAETLLQRAEQALERARCAGLRRTQAGTIARRRAPASLLGPVVAG